MTGFNPGTVEGEHFWENQGRWWWCWYVWITQYNVSTSKSKPEAPRRNVPSGETAVTSSTSMRYARVSHNLKQIAWEFYHFAFICLFIVSKTLFSFIRIALYVRKYRQVCMYVIGKCMRVNGCIYQGCRTPAVISTLVYFWDFRYQATMAHGGISTTLGFFLR